jgi:hypothetical protein
MRSYKLAFLFVIACTLIYYPAFAQQVLGTISGTVADTSGAVLGQTSVTVTNLQTGATRQLSTQNNGAYAVQDLPIGSYSLVFTHSGFETQTYPAIQVQAGRTATVNVQLKPGSVSTSVEVTANPMLNMTDTTNGYVLDHTEVQQTPLATGSFTQLAVLSPGVSAEFINGTGTNEGMGNQPIWANGQRDTDNTFQLNGIDTGNLFNGKSTSQVASGRVVPNTGENFTANNPGGVQTSTSVYDAIGNALPTPSPETVQEIQVNTSMYDASQGATSGAHIDVTTLSGTNDYHGQAYLYRQTDWLNAAPFFYKQNSVHYGGIIPDNQVVPQLHRFTSGATLGGPIVKNKLFGFLSYNAVRVSDQLNGTQELFLPYGLTDDRSETGIINAVNSTLNGGTFTGTLNPAAVKLLQFKLPNGKYLVPSVGPNAQAELEANHPDAILFGHSTFSADMVNGNFDYNLSKADTLSARYYWQHDPTTNPFTSSNVDGFTQRLDAGGQVGALTNSYTPSSHFSTQQTIGYSRLKVYSTNDQPLTAQQAGINLFGYSTFPGIRLNHVNGITSNGLKLGPTSEFYKNGVFQNRIEPSANAIATLGRHTLTFGGNYSFTQLNIRNRRQNTGIVTVNTFETFAAGTPLVSNNSTFLQGASNRYYRANTIGVFVQDKWQLHPNLSVTGGVRFDYDGPLVEKYGNLFSFDPTRYSYDFATDIITNNGFIIAGNNKQYHTPGVSDSTLKNLQYGIAPRIGFAWGPGWNHGKVVFRGGVGLYYNRGEYFTYFSPGAGSGTSGPFGVTQEPPFVVPVNAPKGATLSNPFGTVEPNPPTGNPQDFSNYLPNRTAIQNGAQTYPFGAYDIHNKLPYTENWTLDMQWQLRRDIALDIGYVGNRGRHGVIPVPFNQPLLASAAKPVNGEIYNYGYQTTDTNGNNLTTEPYNTYDGGNSDLRVPYIGYSINSVTYKAAGNSAYDALQAHVQKQMGHGLQFGVSYTFSHSLDEQSGLGLFYNGSNPLNLRSGYASSDFDRTHIINFNYVYQLPNLVRGRNWISKLTNGWGIQGITVLQSGQPYSIEDYSGAVASLYYGPSDGITNPIIPLAPGYSPHRALTRHSGAFQDSSGTPIPALNDSAFYVPFVQPGQKGVPPCGVSTAGAPVCDVFETDFAGDGQRNVFRQSFQKRADISLVKTFPITERFLLKYTFDAYNVTNTSSFDIPNNSIGTGNGGNGFSYAQVMYDSTQSTIANQQGVYSILSNGQVSPGLGLGVVQQTIGSPRQIQMSLRLIY